MQTEYYIDAQGNYLGGYSKGNESIPAGAIKVPSAPSNASDKFINGSWVASLLAGSESVRAALQHAIDLKAIDLGFSGGNALMLYASFTNPFKAIALPFAQWESTVWAEAETYKQEVIAGTKPMLSGADAVLLMPELNLPN